MCGEKHGVSSTSPIKYGSPPHVRGKGIIPGTWSSSYGITPACAGKRRCKAASGALSWDHPRMCGEKGCLLHCSGLSSGSPPHVRGKGPADRRLCWSRRITPACAGKRLKRSRSTVPPVAIVPLFPSVCNKPVASDGSPAGRDAPLFLPAENAVPASPAYNLRSL